MTPAIRASKTLVAAVVLAGLLSGRAAGADATDAGEEKTGAAALATGLWTFGAASEPEPKERTVTLPLNCYGGGAQMELTRKGDAVRVEIRWYPPVTGAEPRYTVDQSEELRGTLDGNALVLTGEHVVTVLGRADDPGAPKSSRQPVRYALQLNDRGHLVGTLVKGKRAPVPFWAAPAVRKKGQCGPPPP